MKTNLNFQYRISFILYFAIVDLKTKFKNTFLGFIWAAIEPLLYFVVLYLVFSTIRASETDFAIYLISGIMMFHLFVKGTNSGLVSLVSNRGILESIKIKRDFFPIVATTAIGILAFVDLGVFFGLMPVFNFVPTWTIIFLPLPFILLLVLILGLSYFLSIVNVYVRDIQYMWGIFVHSLLFISPTFWRPEEVDGILLQIHSVNPLGLIMHITHKLVTYGEIPPLEEWLYVTTLVVSIFLVGYFVFHKLQHRIVEDI